jgi:hypothetical protein
MPGFYLKRMVMDNFNSKEVDPDIADSIDFMVENVSTNNHNGRSNVTNYIRQNNCYHMRFNYSSLTVWTEVPLHPGLHSTV